LTNLGVMQRSESWGAMTANSALARLSSSQLTVLQSAFAKKTYGSGEVVWIEKKPASHAVLVLEGHFVFARAPDMKPFGRGAFLCEMGAMINDTPLTTSLLCAKAGSVLIVTRADWLSFLDKNPGMRVIFLARKFVE
jgi:hypothetical protein